MRNLLTVLLLVLSSSLLASTTFGTGADKSKLVDMADLLANPDAFTSKEVTISGKIDSVCKKMGCWMEFMTEDKAHRMRVKVKDGVMVFPVSAKGKKGYATGTISRREMTMEQTVAFFKHIAEEQGTEFNEADITQPHTLIQLKPVGVSIED